MTPGRDTGAAEPAPAEASAGGARRYLTVLACAISDADTLAARISAAAWGDLVMDFQVAVFDVARRFDGHYAENRGAAATIYFGYHQARENDAERAVRAGLALIDKLAKINERAGLAGAAAAAVSVGVDSGLVTLQGDGAASGDVVAVARAIETLAPRGAVAMSRRVHSQVAALIGAEELGSYPIAGLAVALFQVTDGGRPAGRQGTGRAGTPLVGRDRELDLLASCWNRVRSGKGQVVLLSGEAGIGKSRLIEEFRARLRRETQNWIAWPCSQLLQNTPFHPLSAWAIRRFGGPEVPATTRLAEVERVLRGLGLDASAVIPLLHSILEIPLPEQYLALVAAPSAETRRRVLDMLCQWALAGARAEPLVLVLEDAHWADPSMIELARVLAERGGEAPLLFLVSARPEFKPGWSVLPHQSTIALAPLEPDDVQRMVAQVAHGKPAPPDLADRVASRTGGIPLFIEEVTRHLLEAGQRSSAPQVPMTLQALLMARLDRLGPARELAQIAATLGVEFARPVLQAVAAMDEAPLSAALETLITAGLLETRDAKAGAAWRFKHALIQNVAYESLPAARRRELHRTAARIIAERFPAIAESRPELLAHHLAEAGETQAAIAAWETAARDAAARGASAEVASGVRRAIDLVMTLPDTPARATREFQLRTRLAECYWAAKGQSADETVAAFNEALEAGRHVDDPKAVGMLLSGLISASNQRAEFDAARALGLRLEALAQAGGPFVRGWGSFRRGQTCIYVGELAEARRLYDEALAVGGGEDRLAAGGVELVGAVTVFSPWLSALMGDIDRGRDEARTRLQAAEAKGGPHNRAHVRLGCALLEQSLGDAARTEEHARTLLMEGETFRMPIFVAYATLLLGWSTGRQGRAPEAVRLMRRGIDLLAAAGTSTNMNIYRARLGHLLADAGELERGLAVVEEAVALRYTAPFQEPEVLRIKAELLRCRGLPGDVESAETVLREALDGARRMGIFLHALEIATQLARHLSIRGETDAARGLIEAALGPIKGGADTPLPRAARALRAQLAATQPTPR